jgi:hypothetical protein
MIPTELQSLHFSGQTQQVNMNISWCEECMWLLRS